MQKEKVRGNKKIPLIHFLSLYYTHFLGGFSCSKQLPILMCVMLFAATAPLALAAGNDSTKGGKVTVVVTHEVKNYATWRTVFNSDAENRAAAGFQIIGVYTDVKNPNMVTVIGDFTNGAAADTFMVNPKLKEAMEKGGVVGKPDVKVLIPGAK
jgi:quinol monooxygenase YgiN